MFKLILQWCVLSCATLACVNVSMAGAAQKPVKVVASIKPLQLIAASLLGDSAETTLLISADNSPHHYNMKPSDVRRLQDADLVIWVGPDLERFLVKPLKRNPARNLALLSEDEQEEHDEHAKHEDHDEHEEHDEHAKHEDHDEHEEHDEHAKHEDHDEHDEHDEHAKHEEHDEHEEHAEAEGEHHHDHDHGNDPHLWMAPERILEAAELITHRLQEDYPERAAEFEERLHSFEDRLKAADSALAAQLKDVQKQGFYVFHDAFEGFVDHYGLNQLGYFTVDPGRKPGAKRLNQIRTALEESKATCVFIEPQFEAPVVRAIVGDLPVGKGMLDPLGRDIAADNDGIFNFLNALGSEIRTCLKNS
ncbi:zinc ABC transporter substrate-binding protein [Aliamphritea spongicola]|uniref:zinc ABC transporter substrate-binding protein n=1 Tax=Aliamphritea spongicola TaxID=707589 RepID=UPI00196A93D7|nr:zinc ABC transporter substrate-binding protein [Aliamphritea spongicola]MBN3562169.1 zinc ABC transporter substrate-binding protein [Aliamphritea spongicola]